MNTTNQIKCPNCGTSIDVQDILLNESVISDLSLNPQWEIEKWCNAFSAEVLVPSDELLRMEIVRSYQRQGQKEWKERNKKCLNYAYPSQPHIPKAFGAKPLKPTLQPKLNQRVCLSQRPTKPTERLTEENKARCHNK